MLYEKVLDDLLVNQEKLTKTERVKLFVTLSGYLFPKGKPTKEIISEQQFNLPVLKCTVYSIHHIH
jgi:hypothetical protein